MSETTPDELEAQVEIIRRSFETHNSWFPGDYRTFYLRDVPKLLAVAEAYYREKKPKVEGGGPPADHRYDIGRFE